MSNLYVPVNGLVGKYEILKKRLWLQGFSSFTKKGPPSAQRTYESPDSIQKNFSRVFNISFQGKDVILGTKLLDHHETTTAG